MSVYVCMQKRMRCWRRGGSVSAMIPSFIATREHVLLKSSSIADGQ